MYWSTWTGSTSTHTPNTHALTNLQLIVLADTKQQWTNYVATYVAELISLCLHSNEIWCMQLLNMEHVLNV